MLRADRIIFLLCNEKEKTVMENVSENLSIERSNVLALWLAFYEYE